MRNPFDAYFTPTWQTEALMRRLPLAPLAPTVLECCSGDCSLSDVLTDYKIRATLNDIDPARDAHLHLDATKMESWKRFGRHDWVITNPPFNSAFEILERAVQHVNVGVAMLLRISFLEPTLQRGFWLSKNPPQRVIILPRWSYKGNGKTDSVTTAWMVWAKHLPPLMEVVPPSEKGQS